MADNLLKEGAATFYIVDESLENKDDDPFILWLKSEGFKNQRLGHATAPHSLYINVNSKVYNWAMGGVPLSPIIFNHAIHIDEFKSIYSIFKKYEGLPPGYYTLEQYRDVFGDDNRHLTKEPEEIENKEWRLCAVGNIVDSHLEDGIIRRGTSAFPPKAKVYLCGKNWNKNYTIPVIGLTRGKRYECLCVPVKTIENVRFSRVFTPAVLYMMADFECSTSWWERTANDKREIKKFIAEFVEFQKTDEAKVFPLADAHRIACYGGHKMDSLIEYDNGYFFINSAKGSDDGIIVSKDTGKILSEDTFEPVGKGKVHLPSDDNRSTHEKILDFVFRGYYKRRK